MGLSQTNAAVQIERVVGLPRRFSDSLSRGVGKSVARRYDEPGERVFLVQRCGRNVRQSRRFDSRGFRPMARSLLRKHGYVPFDTEGASLSNYRLGSSPL